MRVCRVLAVLFLLTLLAPPGPRAAPPEDVDAWCATHPGRLAATWARHQSHRRQLERQRAVAQKSGLPEKAANVYRFGHVAVIEDDGTVVAPPRPFDLANRSIQFLRRPKGMSAVRSAVGYRERIGGRRGLGDDDLTLVVFTNGLQFPFFGEVHTSVWLSSNGYLSFDFPDPLRPIDSVFDAILGPPMIAPLLADLDPSAGGGVYVELLPRRVRFTWLDVPEYGTGNLATFQVTLFDTGRVLFAYRDVEVSYGVVGIFPGGAAEAEAFDVNYDLELPLAPRRAAMFEGFSADEQIDEILLLEEFYKHFQDSYDHLVVWFDFPLTTGDGGGAFQATIKNDIRGIGLPVFDLSGLMGLDRLESYVQMGDLSQYPQDPVADVLGTYSTMDLLAHQVGHRWLGLVLARGADGMNDLDLLDSNLEHWSFHADTDASVLGGNDLDDNGDGSFTTVAATARYCPLDLYLMGLAPAAAVPNFFYLDNVTGGPPSTAAPEVGVTMNGTRVDVAMADLTESMGPRVPPHAAAPKVFNMAFVLLTRDGQPPSSEALDKLAWFRRYWHRYFKEATDFRGRVNTTLKAIPQ